MRLQSLEELLLASLQPQGDAPAKKEAGPTSISTSEETDRPGFTTIRTLTYKGRQLEVPYFLRDAFLLPQRFSKSETFLIRLGS